MKSLFFLTFLPFILSVWELKTKSYSQEDKYVTPTQWKSGEMVDIYVERPVLVGVELLPEVFLLPEGDPSATFYAGFNVREVQVPGVNGKVVGHLGRVRAGRAGSFQLGVETFTTVVVPHAPPAKSQITKQVIKILQ